MSKEPGCAAVHKGKPATTESVVAGANGGLANVVVYITQGLSGNEPVSTQSVEIPRKVVSMYRMWWQSMRVSI